MLLIIFPHPKKKYTMMWEIVRDIREEKLEKLKEEWQQSGSASASRRCKYQKNEIAGFCTLSGRISLLLYQ